MAEKALRANVKEAKDGIYLSNVVDSRPNVLYVDHQLAFLIQYVQKKSGEPVERFLEYALTHGRRAHGDDTQICFKIIGFVIHVITTSVMWLVIIPYFTQMKPKYTVEKTGLFFFKG